MKRVWWIRLVLPAKGNLLMDFLSLQWVLLAFTLVSHDWISCKRSVCESSTQGFNITFGLSCLLSSWLWLHNSNRQLSALYKHTHSTSCHLQAVQGFSADLMYPHTQGSLCCSATLILQKIKYEQLADRLSLQTIFSSHYALAPFRSSCLISYHWGCLFFFFDGLFSSLLIPRYGFTPFELFSCSFFGLPSTHLIPTLRFILSPFHPQIGQIALKLFLVF